MQVIIIINTNGSVYCRCAWKHAWAAHINASMHAVSHPHIMDTNQKDYRQCIIKSIKRQQEIPKKLTKQILNRIK